MLQLIKATSTNGIWARLLQGWEKELKKHGAPKDWAKPFLEHATKIIADDDSRYSIFVACGGSKGAPRAPYDGFVHINFKLMKTSAAEIRLIWNRVAPRYQFEDLREQLGEVQATFISGAMDISSKHPKRPPIKMFLGNPADIAFGRNFALIISHITAMRIKAVVKGNWLHIS